MDKAKTEQLLERLGQALSAGDLKGISNCWAFPALFLSDDDTIVLASASQLEQIVAQAREWYRKQDIASTKPELERVDLLSENLISVDVRWPSYDASGKEKASERSHYILQLGNDEQMHIRLGLTRTM
jgi:hypothetical protein